MCVLADTPFLIAMAVSPFSLTTAPRLRTE
nr:MAG TPA: hypothetical protein [Caudoviricetes sp.]